MNPILEQLIKDMTGVDLSKKKKPQGPDIVYTQEPVETVENTKTETSQENTTSTNEAKTSQAETNTNETYTSQTNTKQSKKDKKSNRKTKRAKRERKPRTKGDIKRYKTIAVVVFVLALGFNTFYTVSEQENAVVTRGGKFVESKPAGLHFKLPYFDKVTFVNTSVQAMEIGYRDITSENGEYEDRPEESIMITEDFNFVTIDFYVDYKVSEPEDFVFMSSDPTEILRNIVQSEIRGTVSKYTVDEVLTTGKTEIQAAVLENANKKAENYGLGLYISNVSIQDAEPPTEEVNAAFKAVESAKQNRETEINKASQFYNEELPKARSDSDKTIKEAESVKESRIAEAKGQVARFNKMYAEYAKNKGVTKTRMYMEAMEEVLPGVKVYIEDGNGVLKMLPLNE